MMTADQDRKLLKSSIESTEFQIEKINNKIEVSCKVGNSFAEFSLTADETNRALVISQLENLGFKVTGYRDSNIISISWSE